MPVNSYRLSSVSTNAHRLNARMSAILFASNISRTWSAVVEFSYMVDFRRFIKHIKAYFLMA